MFSCTTGVTTGVTVGAGSTFNVSGDLNAASLTTAGAPTLSGGGTVDAINVTGGAFQMSSPPVTNMTVSGGTATVAGLSVAQLEVSGGELKSNGNKFVMDASATLLPNVRHAFLRGPEGILIELIDRKPA